MITAPLVLQKAAVAAARVLQAVAVVEAAAEVKEMLQPVSFKITRDPAPKKRERGSFILSPGQVAQPYSTFLIKNIQK
jgi:hypothetical protein